jgi:hypothetical protein
VDAILRRKEAHGLYSVPTLYRVAEVKLTHSEEEPSLEEGSG